jgi:hypothetical protein
VMSASGTAKCVWKRSGSMVEDGCFATREYGDFFIPNGGNSLKRLVSKK